MTEPDGIYGEDIRHALGALAGLVVPTGDGLDKIRKRTRHRPPALAWLVAYGTYLPRALINMVRVPGSELILMAKGQSTVFKRLWAGRRRLTPESGSSPQAWLRPVLAASGALVIVVAVVLAVPRLHQTITTAGMNNASAGHNLGGNNGPGGGSGQTANASEASTSGKKGQVPPGGSKGKCAGKSNSGSGNTGSSSSGVPPVMNTTPAMTAGTSDTTVRTGTQVTHCPSASPSSQPTSPSPSTSSTSPGSSSSPAGPPPTSSPPTTQIPPTGGDPPTPTSTAITNSGSPSPSDSDGGGS